MEYEELIQQAKERAESQGQIRIFNDVKITMNPVMETKTDTKDEDKMDANEEKRKTSEIGEKM